MSRHVALLRGINVGRAKRIGMADLRALVTSLGYTGVRTLLASGNVVFDAPAGLRGDHGARLQRAIEDQLGVSSRVTILSAADVAGAVATNPLAKVTTNPSRLLVAVPARPADRGALEPLTRQDWSPEAIALGRRVAYLWCPESINDSPLLKAMERALRSAVTSRNWSTMLKLHALVEGGSP
jgi:uncharacterized protein (DUF1697 family)